MLDVHLRSGNAFLAARLFLPTRPGSVGVVFCHGWSGAHHFEDLHAELAEAGVTVVSFEQRGYGLSTGRARLSAWPADMAAVAEWLRRRDLRVWVMGLSTGGTVALATAAQHPWIAGAIALSPFARLDRIRADYPPARKIFAEHFGELRAADHRAADALAWAPAIAPRPAVVVHTRRDEIVPFAHAELLRDKAGVTLWELPRGDHRLLKVDRPALFRRIRRLITRT
jgi:pimeloyl-ACP methyl ester carboxylesterase